MAPSPNDQAYDVIAASYAMAEKLYGLTFTEITGTVPVFHPDVRVFEVKDKATGEFTPETKLVDTTVGRALLSEILPKGLPFSNINKALKKKEISRLINTSFRKCGLKDTVVFADRLLQAAANDPRATPGHVQTARRFRLYTELYADRGALLGCCLS